MPSDTPNTVPDSGPILLNADQAAKVLNISTRTLWSLRASKSIPFIRIGQRVLFPKAKLVAWVEARLEGGAA